MKVDGILTEVEVRARRAVIEHCLYGVDINPMAVEMAKLSLWLVSMDPKKPFTFLDANLVAGDSLLGVANLDQIEALHLLPHRGRALHHKFVAGAAAARGMVADLAQARSSVAAMPGDTVAQLDAKRARLAEADRFAWRIGVLADLVTGAGLVGAGKGLKQMDDFSALVALRAEDLDGAPADSEPARRAHSNVAEWHDTDRAPGADARRPLHWLLAFP